MTKIYRLWEGKLRWQIWQLKLKCNRFFKNICFKIQAPCRQFSCPPLFCCTRGAPDSISPLFETKQLVPYREGGKDREEEGDKMPKPFSSLKHTPLPFPPIINNKTHTREKPFRLKWVHCCLERFSAALSFFMRENWSNFGQKISRFLSGIGIFPFYPFQGGGRERDSSHTTKRS